MIGVEWLAVPETEFSRVLEHAPIVDPEREELAWLLTSGVLGRSGNISRVLKYICEEHFSGRAQEIKEYTVATEALGRPPDFDPQSDTIVRVTVHALRKRLQDVYLTEGAHRPIRLVIPPGHYAPSFVPQGHSNGHRLIAASEPQEVAETEPASQPPPPADLTVATANPPERHRPSSVGIAVVVLAVAVASIGIYGYERHQRAVQALQAQVSEPTPPPQDAIWALMGANRNPYKDHSGNTWSTGNYCQGGTNVNITPQRIQGTEDPELYFGGVRGIAHCIIPVNPGMYEVHFHFAETADLPAATHPANLSINAGPTNAIDVVDNAGGDGFATSTVVTGVAPENDGAIHFDFISDVSLLNAVEILPAPSDKLLPVRIVANAKPFIDEAKQIWTADKYFAGGRRGQDSKLKPDNLGIYQSVRVGRFRYTIPATPRASYRLRLYFREPWFGKENGGIGGPGSRIFNVACNGVLLLKNFDILAEGKGKPVIMTFDHVQASASGGVEVYFMPVVNYPVINAIELLPAD